MTGKASHFIGYNQVERTFFLKTTTVYIEEGQYILKIKLMNKLGQSSLYAFKFNLICSIDDDG